jgi:hypothetical protein
VAHEGNWLEEPSGAYLIEEFVGSLPVKTVLGPTSIWAEYLDDVRVSGVGDGCED